MHQTLDTGFDLDEGAVGTRLTTLPLTLAPMGNLDSMLSQDWLPFCFRPRKRVPFAVDVEDDDVEFLANAEQLGDARSGPRTCR